MVEEDASRGRGEDASLTRSSSSRMRSASMIFWICNIHSSTLRLSISSFYFGGGVGDNLVDKRLIDEPPYMGLVRKLLVAVVGYKQPMGLLLQPMGGLAVHLGEPASPSLPTKPFVLVLRLAVVALL